MKHARQARYKQRKPWVRLLEYARRRCSDPKAKAWPSHGAKGIKVFLTLAELETVWKRDGGDKMVKPSLDRRESDKHYCIHNVRIIEHYLNARLPHDAALRAEDQGDPSFQHEDVPDWVRE